jgi:hypothetical protein
LETARVGDLDEHRRGIRVRWTVEKNDRYRHLELPDDLFAAIVQRPPDREDRDLAAPLFPGLDEAALRTSITRACKATGDAAFLAARAPSPARLACRCRRAAGRFEARVAADHYVHALTDYREVDRSIALTRART